MSTQPECEQVRIAAMALSDGESALLSGDAVDEHLHKCDACREAIARLDIENLFPASARLATHSNNIWTNIQQSLEEEDSSMNDASTVSNVQTNLWTTQKWLIASLAITACVLIAVGFWISNGFQNSYSPIGPITPGPKRDTKTVAQKDFHAQELTRNTLDDGTVVVAQPGSEYRIEESRRIRLQSGSLYLIVAKSGKPFVVMTKDGEVRATGTRFAVSTNDSTAAAVAQGRVVLASDEGNTELHAGQQGELSKGKRPTREPAQRLSHLVSWAKEALSQEELLVKKAESENGLIALDPWGQETRLTLRKYQVDVQIEDGIARTTIDQTFFNHYPWNSEGTFYFPLPPDASVSRLAMYVNGQLNEGGMVERGRGQQIYNTILYQRRDPALLEMMEGNVFKMRIFPLEGRQEKRIFLSYTQKLDELYGTMRYWFPMDHTNSIAKQLSVRVRIKGGAMLYEPRSSTHKVVTTTDGDDLLLEYDAERAKPDQDFLLHLKPRKAPQPTRLATCEKDGHKFVFGRFTPEIPGKVVAAPRQWIVLNDVSASRSNIEAEAQRYILQRLVEEADDEDSVFLIDLNTRAQPVSKEFASVRSPAAKKLLEHRTEARIGATNLFSGIEAVAKVITEHKVENPHILYLGDGVATDGQTEVFSLVRAIPKTATFIGVGVGKKVDSLFLQAAADRTGGIFTTINPDEDIDWRVFDMIAALNTPRLTKLKVSLLDANGEEMVANAVAYPSSRSVSEGETLTVVARCEKDWPAKIVLEGKSGTSPFHLETSLDDAKNDAEYIPRLWAKRHIDELTKSDMKRKDEIIELSKQYYVVTPLTSLIVLEDDAMYKEFNVERGRKDHWALYPAPKEIEVVKEPVDQSQWGWWTAAKGEDAKIEAKEKPESVQDIVDSVQFRVNAPFYFWRPQQNNQGRYALYQLLDSKADPTQLLTYWMLLASGDTEAAVKYSAAQSRSTESADASDSGARQIELRALLSTDGELALGPMMAGQGFGWMNSGGGFGGGGGGFGMGGGGLGGMPPRMLFDGTKVDAGLILSSPVLPSSGIEHFPLLVDSGKALSRGYYYMPMQGNFLKRLAPPAAVVPAFSSGFSNSNGGLQPELVQAFQTSLSRRWSRINRDIDQFNRQYGYWGGWDYGDTWDSIDLTKSGGARWYGGLEGLLEGDESSESLLMPNTVSLTVSGGLRMPPSLHFIDGDGYQPQPVALASIGFYDQALKSQPGAAAVLAADLLVARRQKLLKGEETPESKKELAAIDKALANAEQATSRLESSGPFWSWQGWEYRPRPATFQSPQVQLYGNYSWSFDLTRYAPALYSGATDVLNEVANRYSTPAQGKIDAKAEARIAAARKAIRPLKIRLGDKLPEVIVASGDRFVVTRHTEMNLHERMVCDGENILHFYEEIGLVARRPATSLRRAALRQFAPHLVDPADWLATQFDAQLVSEDDDSFTLSLTPIGQSAEADNLIKVSLRVDHQGRVHDRSVFVNDELQFQMALTYVEDEIQGRLLDKDAKQLAEFKYSAEPVELDENTFATEVGDYVAIDMPLRKPSYYVKQLESLGDDQRQEKIDLKRHHALSLIQEFHTRRWGQPNAEAHKSLTEAFQLMKDAGQEAKLGDLTLLGSAGVYQVGNVIKPFTSIDTSHPVYRFFEMRHASWNKAKELAEDKRRGLVAHLSAYQRAVWNRDEKERYEFFAEEFPDSPLLLGAAYYCGGAQGSGDWKNWFRLYEHPKWRVLALLMSEPQLHADEYKEALAKMYVEMTELGYDVPITQQIAAKLRSWKGGETWRKIAEDRFARARKPERIAPLLRFAEDAMLWNESELADKALALAREQLDKQDTLIGRLGLAQTYWAGGRLKEALALYDEVLAGLEKKGVPASPALLASVARLAQQAGEHGRAIELEEQALAIEHKYLPDLINLQAFRQRYTWLWQQYQTKVTEAVSNKDEDAVEQWLHRAETAWLRWYEVDQENAQMVQQMATLQMTAGREADAWLYLSTVVDQKPHDANSYYTVGLWYRGRKELDEAQQWYARAFEWDTANPRWLFERAELLKQIDRRSDAGKLYQQIIDGQWAPGLQGYVDQAKNALNN